MGSRPYLTDFNGRNPGLFTQVFPYFLPKCYTEVVGQVCHDHLGGGADVLTCHCICELRVVGHRGAPCQPFSRILSRTVGGRGVRMAALPSTLARVLRRHPWTHGCEPMHWCPVHTWPFNTARRCTTSGPPSTGRPPVGGLGRVAHLFGQRSWIWTSL
jgi:hypothetical protein